MSKIITEGFAKRKPLSWFNGKKATTNVKLQNIGGEVILKGTIVTITSRGRSKNEFNVKDEKTGIQIYNNWCEHLELIEDASNS